MEINFTKIKPMKVPNFHVKSIKVELKELPHDVFFKFKRSINNN